ncbi:MAG: hypothetical protein J6C27_00950 [Clostridia bacterium]|nr:hypothetical protein [Clostridia bacterium]
MKSVLISIQPKWCELIANGKKTVEVRKTKPKLETPFKVYIYCTNNRGSLHTGYDGLYYHKSSVGKNDSSCISGKVIGEFVCKFTYNFTEENQELCGPSFDAIRLTPKQLSDYAKGKMIYGWHISDLVIYDKPRELSEFVVPSKIGCANEGKCKGCIYLDEGNGYNVEDDCSACFSTDEFKPLRKAPQSWCYVESGAQLPGGKDIF